jgi:hypothetical protein
MMGILNTLGQKIESGLKAPKQKPQSELPLPENLFKSITKLFDFKDNNSPFGNFINKTEEVLRNIIPTGGGIDPVSKSGNFSVSGILPGTTGKNVDAKLRPTPQDLLKLDGKNALGYLLLYWKLDEIHQGIKDKKGETSQDDGAALGGLGIVGKIFKTLSQGAGGILAFAGALLLFAGALVLFQAVQWNSALLGMAMFAAFIGGAYFLAKGLEESKAEKTFIQFGIMALLLTGSFILFSVALLIASKTGLQAIAALPSLILFAGFIWGAKFVAEQMKVSLKDFMFFAIGAAVLSASIMVFSLSLIVAATTLPYVIKALPVLGLFALFITGAAGLGLLLGPLMPAIALLGAGAILLSLGLMAFSSAIYITDKLVTQDRIQTTLGTLGVMTKVFIQLALMSPFLILGSVAALVMSAASIALLVGLTAFGLAMKAGSLIAPALVVKNSLVFAATALLFTSIIPAGIVSLIAIPLILILGIASVALFAMTVPLMKALEHLTKMSPLLPKAALAMINLTAFMNVTAVAMGLSTLASVAILASGMVLLPAVLALTAIVGGLYLSTSLLSSINQEKLKIASHNINLLFSQVLIPFGLQAAAASVSLLLAVPAIVIINTVSGALFQAAKAVSTLTSFDIDQVKVQRNLQGISTVLDKFTGMALPNPVKMAVIGASIVPLSDAMRGMIKVVKDLQGISEQDIEHAQGGIHKLGNLITSENRNDWSFNKLLQQMDGIGGGKVRASQALGNVVDVVDKLTGIITKMGGALDTQAALTSMRGIGDTILYLNNQVLDKINGIPRDIQERIGKVIESSSLIKDKLLPLLQGWALPPASGIGQAIEQLKRLKEIPDSSRTLGNIANSIDRLDRKKIQGVGDAFTSIKNNLDLQGRLDPLIQFANKAGDFNKIADAFQKIANATGQLDAKKGLFTSLGSIDGGKFSANARGFAAGGTATNPRDDEIVKKLSEVYELLKTWYSRKPSVDNYSTPITALEPERKGTFLPAIGVT